MLSGDHAITQGCEARDSRNVGTRARELARHVDT